MTKILSSNSINAI